MKDQPPPPGDIFRGELMHLLAAFSEPTGGSVPMSEIVCTLISGAIAALDGVEQAHGPLTGDAKICRFQLHAVRAAIEKMDW